MIYNSSIEIAYPLYILFLYLLLSIIFTLLPAYLGSCTVHTAPSQIRFDSIA